ncbi:tumor necrosis factor ligand superfamily member 14-like [Plectropomus leopardus]|uniref:tumor necrosis factor ligand superfamily member 14-like n=1 Tax=Plectropomus leopardus TaxID=160734 RepID=UPI001C4B11C3|nr:tumor necrosis factor ligand superfamily member 14-like [Plectropomus leopardus]XP_042341360.1 tumor necrosis factor ligand superfamily member 14-like [Plectropomus leopardus]XP_042341361.1 tumor necrosis factor ligand superfamily member 14-like [Plectropomus leopardus]
MAEAGVATCPQVFVVDSQANYVSVPGGRKQRWARISQKFLLPLVGLALLGLVVEGFFIYSLYEKTQEFSNCKSHPLCRNLSTPQASAQQGGPKMGQGGHKESNEIPTVKPLREQVQQRPFAQLTGSNTPKGANNVVLWENIHGDAITYNMSYDNGHLVVQQEGYYYIYSKLTLDATEECSLIQHKVMRDTSAYDKPLELMRSKSNRCLTREHLSTTPPREEDLWNSFLAGIFHLQRGDKIFVTLEDINKLRPGPKDNLMGAYLIFPGKMLQ